jgi:hypothetical protein
MGDIMLDWHAVEKERQRRRWRARVTRVAGWILAAYFAFIALEAALITFNHLPFKH